MSRLLAIVACLCALAAATPLDDYVNKYDPAYSWTDTGVIVKPGLLGWTGYILNMTSQQWLPGEWKFATTNNASGLWWHYMLVVVPNNLDPNHSDTGFLWITGGDNKPTDLPTDPYSEDALVLASVCVANGVVGAALFQVPNQPLMFFDETPTPQARAEDAMVAWTWKHFIEDPSSPEWLARLPMTKAAVRALDTLAAYRAPYQTLTKFGIAGASKRGWDTWTLGAVDKRIIAMMPVVMDELNFVKNIQHHYRAYGGWSFALKDYWNLNFTLQFDNPNLQAMMDIIDPIVYKDRYTFPKLIIDAAGDEFFLPDDEAYWWDEMTEPKWFLMVPNAEHSMATGIFEVIPAVCSFVAGVLQNQPIPKFTWTMDYVNGSITMTVPPGQPAPINVTMYAADSLKGSPRRDFRLIGGYPKPGLQDVFWGGFPLNPIPGNQNTWIASVPVPASGWSGFMIHVKFPGPVTFSGDHFPYEFSTQINIVPNTFPYPACSGEGCLGQLV